MTPGIISLLRDRIPLRPLRYAEAMRLAELQAQRFLALSEVTQPPVPERVIAELPKIRITRVIPFPVSGATHWSSGQWLVALNGAEPATRQRFSLAHEFKHILDHRFYSLSYSAFPESEREVMVEQICDYFAGCLLMPRPWVKRLYGDGIQHLPDLARAFGVSQAAMTVRLSQIGLTEVGARCFPRNADWTFSALNRLGNDSYNRRATTLI